ncbi:MAG TPA: PilZ domain-containing protein [Candidatus Polarisedimenticolia bacterium]|nr:PilZ domain-containing protein [Candidatus Polarisedimenticolia bacterium]
MDENPDLASKRDFARVDVHLKARFLVLERPVYALLRDQIHRSPSIWGPEEEESLRELASTALSSPNGLLARAILDLANQIARMRARLEERDGPMQVAELLNLSGSGGLLDTGGVMLATGALLDLRIEDDASSLPPLRVLAEVVRQDRPQAGQYGLRFVAIHRQDQERLIRYIYDLQRQALRGDQGAPE